MSQRLSMIERDHPQVSVRRQCAMFKVPRSRLYYRPRPHSENTLKVMTRLDELFTHHPFLGYRKLTVLLQQEGYTINHKRVRRLMRQLGLEALYPRPGNSSRPNPAHKVYPYLLNTVNIITPNQVWATDITYIRLQKRWSYLVAILDWHSRYVVSWHISETMEADFCIMALEEALTQAKPEIFNTDQGSQFTSEAFTRVLIESGIKISMDGRGSYHDNIFTERLWRTVKYEEVYLKEYQNIDNARDNLERYFHFYNHERPHQALDYQTPAQVHFALGNPVDMMDNSHELPTYPQALLPPPPPAP